MSRHSRFGRQSSVAKTCLLLAAWRGDTGDPRRRGHRRPSRPGRARPPLATATTCDARLTDAQRQTRRWLAARRRSSLGGGEICRQRLKDPWHMAAAAKERCIQLDAGRVEGKMRAIAVNRAHVHLAQARRVDVDQLMPESHARINRSDVGYIEAEAGVG